MKRIIMLLVIGGAVWHFYSQHNESEKSTPQVNNLSIEFSNSAAMQALDKAKEIAQPQYHFICDGREHCSQMSSYEEAKYFLDNCPNVKMDGDHDGIPCEGQF